MFCSNCGTKLEENSKFCSECGKPIQVSQENTTQSLWIRDINGHKIDVLKLAITYGFFDNKIKSKVNASTYLQKHADVGAFKSVNIIDKLIKDEDLKHAYYKTQNIPINAKNIPTHEYLIKKADESDALGLRCPKCLSKHIEIEKVGYNATKGIIGGILTGGVGLVAGFHGRNKRKGKCLKCGHEWKI